MKENTEEKIDSGFEDLKIFYAKKKNEQEALRRLLNALEKKSKNENTDIKTSKNQK
jgi:hypothetical protein